MRRQEHGICKGTGNSGKQYIRPEMAAIGISLIQNSQKAYPVLRLLNGDLFVCETANGRCLKRIVEFVSISPGTVEDAKTYIQELYACQFDGPFLRDFMGTKPKRK